MRVLTIQQEVCIVCVSVCPGHLCAGAAGSRGRCHAREGSDLQTAVRLNSTEVVKLLITHGANVNPRAADTTLTLAVIKDNFDMCFM